MDQSDLIKCVRKYRKLDDELKTINKQAYKLREDRKFIENEMSDILKLEKFRDIQKLEISDDGSFIKIQRPSTWNKPWNMSSKDLQVKLHNYFKQTDTPCYEDCLKYIVDSKKKELVSKDFAFSRFLKEEDEEDT